LSSVQFRLIGAEGEPIRGHLHLPIGPDSAPAAVAPPVVVFVHGFKGFQDWGPWSAICERFASAGIAAVRFDLSHNGVGPDGVDFSALDKFERNTISKELFDVHTVFAATRELHIDPDRIFLMGHSRGAGDVLIAASEHGAREIAGVILWGSISTFDRAWDPEMRASWKAGKSATIWNSRTGQAMSIGTGFQEDVERNADRLDIERAVGLIAKRGTPLVVIHGSADESVPIEEARRIHRWYRQSAFDPSRGVLNEIEGGTHTLGAVHPFAGWTPQLEEAYAATERFVRIVAKASDAPAPR
jgi:dipeptidyl aminopeptidase/acylaminoacyl peptidase